ncbi:transposase [Burkholderia vietnamiensis]|uniref:transposase n=1 Tax=Burkholderia vietnamiensis TaxID=60552 RepID=UPI0030FE2443
MADKDSELKVVRKSADGRRRYDEKSKRVLIEAALQPGVSVARLAQEHGVNANLFAQVDHEVLDGARERHLANTARQ